MKKLITILLVLIAVGAGGAAYYMRDTRPEPTVTTMPVTRGDIADVVPATGTLEAVTTVDVGTQVSGLVQDMYADFNSIVKKGQIIARLDPSLIQTQIEQRTASVIRAEADLERLRVSLADSERKLAQAQAMWDKQLIPRDQLDTADMNVKTLKSQIKSSEAGLTQAKADLNAQEVNLGHTVIKSPIDGIVISRSVDPGQTVAASMNAPVLYQIAEDLGQMQVLANIDEADVGRMRPGQHVTFRVDAYPTETFTGTVHQVRLQPTVVQNVVVYSTVIRVPNPQWKLKPGMTANVSIEVARAEPGNARRTAARRRPRRPGRPERTRRTRRRSGRPGSDAGGAAAGRRVTARGRTAAARFGRGAAARHIGRRAERRSRAPVAERPANGWRGRRTHGRRARRRTRRLRSEHDAGRAPPPHGRAAQEHDARGASALGTAYGPERRRTRRQSRRGPRRSGRRPA
jgi:HlyD family secretion protein